MPAILMLFLTVYLIVLDQTRMTLRGTVWWPWPIFFHLVVLLISGDTSTPLPIALRGQGGCLRLALI